MKMKMLRTMGWILLAILVGVPNTWARRKKKPAAPPVELSAQGKELEAMYATKLKALQAELKAVVPTVDQSKTAAVGKARAVEKSAEARLAAAQKGFGAIGRGRGLVAHAKGKWIGGADRGIAATKAKLAKATTPEEKAKLEQELAKWQKNRQDGLNALKERQAILDKALAEEPKLKAELEAAQKELAAAKSASVKAIDGLGLNDFLKSNDFDVKLATYMLLTEATPRGLAEFAQQGDAQKKLVDALLADSALIVQMLVADGAKGGKYGQAMKIYTDIQKASSKAKEGVLQRLALAISLEHAVPVGQRSPTAQENAPPHINPVERYQQFEKAYLAGELDPLFKNLDTWDYRFVVDGNEPDATLVWGRAMLRNYRPDHITNPDYRWRYVGAVRTDIRYGSQYNKFDKPELQFFQNILANGGVCGRRAFFGRFILRAFGVPTTARPQRGHAALAHWTPKGWVVCLGGGWGIGWTKTRYNKDRDFLANTQARENRKDYLQVKRAQWVGSVVGEKPVYGFVSGSPGFWYGVSLYRQQAIIEEAKAVALAAVGTDIGEANESKVKEKIVATKIDDRKIVVGGNGVITIPAAACSKPTNNTRQIKFMPCNLGGMQLHYSRIGGKEQFEYTFDAPKAGKYKLTARVVTPTPKQILTVAVNGAKDPVNLDLPYTVGMWDKTAPVEINLTQGKNVITFCRAGDNIRGLTIKDFVITPAK